MRTRELGLVGAASVPCHCDVTRMEVNPARRSSVIFAFAVGEVRGADDVLGGAESHRRAARVRGRGEEQDER